MSLRHALSIRTNHDLPCARFMWLLRAAPRESASEIVSRVVIDVRWVLCAKVSSVLFNMRCAFWCRLAGSFFDH